METRKEWTKPELHLYGSIESITEQTFSKNAGTGDSINLVINGVTTNIPIPGQPGTIGIVSL